MSTLLAFFVSAVALAAVVQKGSSVLPRYHVEERPTWYTELPKVLKEISGLACTADGRVFAHNDERGTVYQLDIHSGAILSSFSIGKPIVRDDFEGLCIVGDTFYLSTSDGRIYAFREGRNEEHIPYTVYDTQLGKKYEMEGLCYNPLTNALLLPVKHPHKEKKHPKRPLFSFALATKTLDPEPYIVLQNNDIENTPNGEFNPSSIEYNPQSNTFFLLAAQGHAILELAPSGTILRQAAIDEHLFPQPEGLTFMPDGTLILSSEAADKHRAVLAGFRLHHTP